MSTGRDTICGFGRDWYRPRPGTVNQVYINDEKEVLFAMPRKIAPLPKLSEEEIRKGKLGSQIRVVSVK